MNNRTPSVIGKLKLCFSLLSQPPLPWNFILGALLVFAFSPLNLWPLGILIPAILLFYWSRARQPFWQGFAFGMGLFGLGISWIDVSLSGFGGTDAFSAALLTLLFVVVLSLFPALQATLYHRFFKKFPYLGPLIIFPSTWVGLEFLRGLLFTGFPWLYIGYTQTFTWLSGIAKIGGIYAVSGLTLFLSASLYLMIHRSSKKAKSILLGLSLVLISASALLKFHSFVKPWGPSLSVVLVQGNISESEKWQPRRLNTIMSTYVQLSRPLPSHTLIVWPENAIPTFYQNAPAFFDALNHELHQSNTALILGIPLQNPSTTKVYNGALALGEAQGAYAKRHLVPFGEYVPFQNWFGPFFQWLDIPMSDFSAGPAYQKPINVYHLPVDIFICYEVAYPLLARERIQQDEAAYMVSLTDDGWFGHSFAAAQQEEMEAMRAIETERPILNASNTGMTSIINSQGQVSGRAPIFEVAVLKGQIQPVKGRTPWLETEGAIFLWAWAGLVLMIILYILKKKS